MVQIVLEQLALHDHLNLQTDPLTDSSTPQRFTQPVINSPNLSDTPVLTRTRSSSLMPNQLDLVDGPSSAAKNLPWHFSTLFFFKGAQWTCIKSQTILGPAYGSLQ